MVCAFFIIFVSAKSFSFQLIIFSFKFMYIDTHSHIYEEEFREDREAVVQRAREAGVNYIVLPDIDSELCNPDTSNWQPDTRRCYFLWQGYIPLLCMRTIKQNWPR